MTFFPESEARRAPQVWVRRKSPKKSSKGSSFLLGMRPKPNQEL
jgi:hypothetical protein